MRTDRTAHLVAAIAAAAGLVMLLLGLPVAEGKLTSGVTNNTDTVASNAYSKCTAAAQGESSTNRSYFTFPFGDASGTTASDASGNSRNGTYSSSGITYGVTSGICPRDNTKAVTLDGTAGAIYQGTQIASPGPQTFSLEIWFKTSVKGGKLIGFGNNSTGSSGQYDRQLYIDSNGKLVFGIYTSTTNVVTSTTTVSDGAWHYALGTFSSSGMTLYLDGSKVGTNTTPTMAESHAGYWRIGYDNLAGWPNPPSNYYFTGSLAYASVYSYVLTADQAQSHYLAGKS